MESSVLLFAIITAFLLINSVSSQAPDVPFPFQVVPSDQIPTGFKSFPPDPANRWLVLEDPNLPDIQQIALASPLPPGLTLVIPNDAESYGYKTKIMDHPPELSTAPINNIKPGLRAVSSAPPGQLLVFRSPAARKPLVLPHLAPGFTATLPVNPPSTVKLMPEFVAPYVPPPLQVIPKTNLVTRGMAEVVNLQNLHIRVLSDPSKPNILTMIPQIPENFKLIAPQTGAITASNVRNVLYPDGFAVTDKWNIPPGEIPLPEPGLGEKLVLTDTNDPGIKTIIAPPPPGVIFVLSKPSPSNIQWTVMKQKDLDQNSQGVAAPAQTWDAVGNYEQGGYQPEAAGAVDNIGQDYQAPYDNSISNANEFANPVYPVEDTLPNNGYPSNDNVVPAFPTDEHLMELIEKDDKVQHAKSSAPTQNKISTRGVLARDHQKLQIFLGCTVYVIYYLGNE